MDTSAGTDSVTGTLTGSSGTRNTRRIIVGMYQFHFPMSDTVAGSNTERITVASSKMPIPRPVANTF
jgi:hypothetical protein